MAPAFVVNDSEVWRQIQKKSSMMPVFVVKEDTLSIEKSREIYVSYIKFF